MDTSTSFHPSVFVIGDSISINYGVYLEQYLASFFTYGRKKGAEEALKDLDLPVGSNGGDSSRVLAYLETNPSHREIPNVDYLLINCGLHDIKTDIDSGTKQVEIGLYRENLQNIVAVGRSMCEELCWIRTTPCDESVHNRPGMTFHRYAADCDAYNAVADEIMENTEVPVIDLYTFTKTLGPDLFTDHVHFHEHVREKQASYIAGWLCSHHSSR